MGATTHLQKLSSAARAHLNELLDEALEETFPASDPIAIAVELQQTASLNPPSPGRHHHRHLGPQHHHQGREPWTGPISGVFER
jgi:hypothetical protein